MACMDCKKLQILGFCFYARLQIPEAVIVALDMKVTCYDSMVLALLEKLINHGFYMCIIILLEISINFFNVRVNS